jgi:hypothetical protein
VAVDLADWRRRQPLQAETRCANSLALRLALNPERLHFFDINTEAAI